MIEISEERYAELLRKEYIYDCLEYAGVDNWISYDDRVISYWEEKD